MSPSQFQTGAGKAWTSAQHSFAQIPRAEIQRSVFDRSCGLKTSFDAGYLIPIFVDEALPGDTFNLKLSSFVRMGTPLFPLMDNLWMDFHFFSVPNRLLWDNWAKFNGEQKNPGDSTVFLVPQFTAFSPVALSLHDYMGILPGVSQAFNSLHARAYNLIWNEWFRDENLQNSVVVDLDDGPDSSADYVLLRRGKRHDYFTSCLPFPQKGSAVSLPLGSVAPLQLTTQVGGGNNIRFTNAGGAVDRDAEYVSGTSALAIDNPAATSSELWFDRVPNLEANLGAATAATINSIRQAFQIQRLLERDARGGSRYTEILRSHFGVVSPDARMQRPEYLGGGSSRINVHPVARTTSLVAGSATPAVAELGAFATASADGVGFNHSFTEHCVVIGLVSVRADLLYQQGRHRMFDRQTRFDFYWPALAHLGEQAVLNREIFVQNTADDLLTFGYQERYAEYRYKPSMTTGLMRSTHAAPLDQWHLGQEFSTLPLLNAAFIVDNPPMSRVLQASGQTGANFFGDFWFQFRCARPMPTFSVPGFVDHF